MTFALLHNGRSIVLDDQGQVIEGNAVAYLDGGRMIVDDLAGGEPLILDWPRFQAMAASKTEEQRRAVVKEQFGDVPYFEK